MADFKRLAVWHKADALSLEAGRVARGIRGQIHAPLRNQMVRAASSIPTNIVEGRATKGNREFARFIGHSIASCSELEYHLISAYDHRLTAKSDFQSLTSQLVEVRKMLYGLLKKLREEGSADG